MGGLPPSLAAGLRDELGLRRAVETGTYRGGGTRLLAGIFPEVVSVELSPELHAAAAEDLAGLDNVRLLQGDSGTILGPLAAEGTPTLWFLDGHWSGGTTAGEAHECPVLAELRALVDSDDSDCVFIDDARLFTAPPPPPHNPDQWPTLLEVIDALRCAYPAHHVTLLADQIIAVPAAARALVDRFGQSLGTDEPPAADRIGWVRRLKLRL